MGQPCCHSVLSCTCIVWTFTRTRLFVLVLMLHIIYAGHGSALQLNEACIKVLSLRRAAMSLESREVRENGCTGLTAFPFVTANSCHVKMNACAINADSHLRCYANFPLTNLGEESVDCISARAFSARVSWRKRAEDRIPYSVASFIQARRLLQFVHALLTTLCERHCSGKSCSGCTVMYVPQALRREYQKNLAGTIFSQACQLLRF